MNIWIKNKKVHGFVFLFFIFFKETKRPSIILYYIWHSLLTQIKQKKMEENRDIEEERRKEKETSQPGLNVSFFYSVSLMISALEKKNI